MASDKHMEKAREIRHLFWIAPFPSDEVSILAEALANAEREGMKRAVAVITEEAAKWPLGARVNMKAVAADIAKRILSEAKEGE